MDKSGGEIPSAWVMKIATIIKDNFTMSEIISLTNSFGANNDIEILHFCAPDFVNKQTIVYENLKNFSKEQMIQFLDELVESNTGYFPEQIDKLSKEVINKFGTNKIETVSKIKKRFSDYPEVNEIWERAVVCLTNGQYHESVNNSRLALEKMLKILFDNCKSLENQKQNISNALIDTPVEFKNLLISQIRSYEIMQNELFKHNFIKEFENCEVKYILNTTYIIMDYLEYKVGKKNNN